jgi:NADPH-dependent glutamate synthase beta subunit-like oxidoreductase
MALRPKIVKLAKMVGGVSGMLNKIDENAPEYYALACVVSDEQADVALAAGLRKNRSVEYLAKKCGKSVEETHRLALELAKIGVFRVTKNEQGGDMFFVQIFAPGILEMMVGNREQLAAHPEIAKGFEEYTRIRMAVMTPMLPQASGLMRVVPIESAISADSKAVPYEKLSYYLDKYDKFSVSDCSCRATRRVLGQGCGHLEHEMCIQMGIGAEYFVRTGRAREITRKEVEEKLKMAEENGLLHEIPNIEAAGETAAICNCCSCSCFGLRVAAMFGAYDAVRSNYVSEIDEEKCVACGQCVEVCPTNALKLGQKLCTVNPTPVEKPRKITEHAWKESDWNINYRENREDVVPTGTAPCKATCPAHIAVQGYIKLASQGKYMEALELIKKENPLPAVCGRICPHKCENECTRGNIDQPIAIDEIKKFIADQEMKSENRFVPHKLRDYSMKKMAVIGAGPAGLSCAYYLASLYGYSVTVFEKQEKLGGMLTLGIPAFRLEKDVVNSEIDVLRQLGVEFKTGVEVGKDVTIAQLREQGYEAFCLAIGAQNGRKLGIVGEDGENVITGVEFLREVNLGRGLQLSGNVVVVGGGNVAIDVARTAVRQGAETTNMYCLESSAEMPALPEEIEEANEEGIVINNGWGPKRIVVENGKVTGVEFKKCVSVFDSDKKFSPKYDENEVITVPADFVLLSIGQSIDWGNMLEGTKVVLGRGNTAVADEFYQTGERGIFAAGDAFSGPKFAIDAIAAGKEAAISMHRAVWPGQTQNLGRDRRIFSALDKQELDQNALNSGYDDTPRQRPLYNSENAKTFRDARQTFTEEQLKKETARCLGCGVTERDAYRCIGCGLCTTKCKFDAIKLVKFKDDHFPEFEKMPIQVAKHVVKRTAKIAVNTVKGDR